MGFNIVSPYIRTLPMFNFYGLGQIFYGRKNPYYGLGKNQYNNQAKHTRGV